MQKNTTKLKAITEKLDRLKKKADQLVAAYPVTYYYKKKTTRI